MKRKLIIDGVYSTNTITVKVMIGYKVTKLYTIAMESLLRTNSSLKSGKYDCLV